MEMDLRTVDQVQRLASERVFISSISHHQDRYQDQTFLSLKSQNNLSYVSKLCPIPILFTKLKKENIVFRTHFVFLGGEGKKFQKSFPTIFLAFVAYFEIWSDLFCLRIGEKNYLQQIFSEFQAILNLFDFFDFWTTIFFPDLRFFWGGRTIQK